jgi:DNA-binding transcriptional ArsR family regulator/DNA-binding transcriptional regulator YiaG
MANAQWTVSLVRKMWQRRNDEECAQNGRYLAHLPRKSAFQVKSLEVEEPVLLDDGRWLYRVQVRYALTKEYSDDRAKRECDELSATIRKACSHKRWGKYPWSLDNHSWDDDSHLAVDWPRGGGPMQRQHPDRRIAESTTHGNGTVDRLRSREAGSDFIELADDLKCLSDPHRLVFLALLAESDQNVTELCLSVGQSQPSSSHSLRLLRQRAMVEPRRDGQHVFYQITSKGRRSLTALRPLIGMPPDRSDSCQQTESEHAAGYSRRGRRITARDRLSIQSINGLFDAYEGFTPRGGAEVVTNKAEMRVQHCAKPDATKLPRAGRGKAKASIRSEDIWKARVRKGLTQEAMAALMGVTPRTISLWEGGRPPHQGVAVKALEDFIAT